jgi:hypothetical protein
MTTLSSYYLIMSIAVATIFALTLAYQTMRYDNDAKKDNASEK